MKIAISGLGRMGAQIARKLSEDGHEVIAHNRSHEPIEEAVSHGAKAAYQKQDVIKMFAGEQLVLWIMLPAEIIDAQLDEWLKLIPQGSIIIDGGNSNFSLTKKRSEKVAAAGSQLLDAGTSGGVWGYQNGFSMMVGGEEHAFKVVEPALQTLARPEGAYNHFGPSGSGHFVKMVHNLDLAAAGEVWQHHSVITSWLNELCRDALKENPNLDGIEGIVAESGEARWTLETAKNLNKELPAIQAAFNVRLESQQGKVSFATKLLAAMRNRFGGHAINVDK
jgi:6-phosphogluconate dehydrogenase